jgi:hypothetical protein
MVRGGSHGPGPGLIRTISGGERNLWSVPEDEVPIPRVTYSRTSPLPVESLDIRDPQGVEQLEGGIVELPPVRMAGEDQVCLPVRVNDRLVHEVDDRRPACRHCRGSALPAQRSSAPTMVTFFPLQETSTASFRRTVTPFASSLCSSASAAGPSVTGV